MLEKTQVAPQVDAKQTHSPLELERDWEQALHRVLSFIGMHGPGHGESRLASVNFRVHFLLHVHGKDRTADPPTPFEYKQDEITINSFADEMYGKVPVFWHSDLGPSQREVLMHLTTTGPESDMLAGPSWHRGSGRSGKRHEWLQNRK